MTAPENAHRALLELSEFSEQEINDNIELLEYTTKRLGLTNERIAWGVDYWIPHTKDIQYRGIRLGMRAIIYEVLSLFDFTRRVEGGEKIKSLYGILPAILTPYTSVKHAGGDKIYVGFPDMVVMPFLQGFFQSGYLLFDKAEDLGFNAGMRHCALNKVGIASRMTGIVPNPTVNWSWGLVCDEGPKVDEYVKSLMDGTWKTIVTRYPHDCEISETDYKLDDRIRYLGDNFEESIHLIEKELDIIVKPEDNQAALDDNDRYTDLLRRLNGICQAANPSPLHNSSLSLLFTPSSIPFNSGLDYIIEAMEVLERELKEAVERGEGITEKDAPRIGLYFMPSNNAWIDQIFTKNGIAPVLSMPTTPAISTMYPSAYTNPYYIMAEAWLKMDFGMGCGASYPLWVEKCKATGIDAIVSGLGGYDRWLSTPDKQAPRYVAEHCDIPVFYIEGDFYDDRNYSEEALKTRIESVSQIIKMKTAAKREVLKAADEA